MPSFLVVKFKLAQFNQQHAMRQWMKPFRGLNQVDQLAHFGDL